MSKNLYYQAASVLIALILITGIILLMGASPIQVITQMAGGAFGTPGQFARVVATLVPLLLCASGLLFTFTAGLYNLGIEGQIVAGAIAAMVPIRLFQDALPAPLVILLAIVAGALGGAFWGLMRSLLDWG
jgi:simple sugar transport system permease protein